MNEFTLAYPLCPTDPVEDEESSMLMTTLCQPPPASKELRLGVGVSGSASGTLICPRTRSRGFPDLPGNREHDGKEQSVVACNGEFGEILLLCLLQGLIITRPVGFSDT